MERSFFRASNCSSTFVPSLPTRDGKPSPEPRSVGRRRVPSLPTRDGKCGPAERRGVEPQVPSLPTRDGKVNRTTYPAGREDVPSLPTRDGKYWMVFIFIGRVCSFPAYLQGMESFAWYDPRPRVRRFPAYLQGMERHVPFEPGKSYVLVPSLPTRDGKLQRVAGEQSVSLCSQPTYKGWKGNWSDILLMYHRVPSLPTRDGKKDLEMNKREDLSVPSLPTRDGKIPQRLDSLAAWQFPAYLQGMESWGSRNSSRGALFVPSLPTRDGKPKCDCPRWRAPRVPSLPTRDGKLSTLRTIEIGITPFPAYLQGMERR